MFNTRNDLALSIRTRVVKRLSARRADTIDPGTQVRSAHCNVTGANFNGAQVRAGLHAASRLGTSDLFTRISREADRYRWLPEPHLHGKR